MCSLDCFSKLFELIFISVAFSVDKVSNAAMFEDFHGKSSAKCTNRSGIYVATSVPITDHILKKKHLVGYYRTEIRL